MLASAALVLPGLGRWTLWQDEAFTWLQAWRPVDRLIDAAAQDRHPPLYYLVVKAFTVLGDHDEAVRLPSALAVIGATWAVGHWGRRHLGRVAGLGAAWTVALAPAAVLMANTARMYALLLLFGSLAWGLSLDLLAGRKLARATLGLGLAAGGLVWTHYAGIAAIAAVGVGATLGLALVPAPPRERARRLGLLLLAFGIAGATFLPWALGPLQFQLANKDAPGARTWWTLLFLGWNFDTRVPGWSWAVFLLQAVGLGLALRRRDAVGVALVGQAAVMLLLPYAMSRSTPAQNPRNYLDLLPISAALVGLVAARAARSRDTLGPVGLAGALGFGALAADPLLDLARRPVSPQETGTGFDYAIEADVLDASVPANAGLHFRPAYLLTRYERYAPALQARTRRPLDGNAWLALARSEWVDSSVVARFTAECTFESAFRNVVRAPEGPGCDALVRWVREIAAAYDYVPFRMELARRALAAGDLDTAEREAEAAAARLAAHPTAAVLLTQVRLRQGDGAGALASADRALALARTWHFGNGPVGEAHQLRAQALRLLGRDEEAARATEHARCARRDPLPNRCDAWWGRFVPAGPPVDLPPPVLPPLPALTESQAAAPPAAPPTGTTRLGLWAFEGEVLPAGWIDAQGSAAAPSATMDVADDAVVLSVATSAESPVAVACGPLVEGRDRLALRLRWRSDLGPGEVPVRMSVEARFADADGDVLRAGGVPLAERPLQTASATGWRVDRFDTRPPAGAAQVRLCVKVEGARPARLAVDWLELVGVDG